MIRKQMRRGAAVFFAAALLWNSSVSAEELVGISEQAIQQEVTAEPETQPPTQAETQAPTEPQPPETQPPTQAETQAPPETQPPAQTETQAQPATTAVTETQPGTAAPAEPKETETEESGIYEWTRDGVSAQVVLPESIDISEDAVLELVLQKKEDKNYQEDVKRVEESRPDLLFSEYLIYDIHFEEADGTEISLKEFEDAQGLLPDKIKVTLQFEKPAFPACNSRSSEKIELFHIRALTDEELAKEREEAKQLAEQAGETGASAIEVDEYKVVPLKAKTEWADSGNGVTSVSFQTDGFSDFVFAVTAPKPETDAEETQSEIPQESETQSETPQKPEIESETLRESETENGSEGQTETESETVLTEPETEPESETDTEAPAGGWGLNLIPTSKPLSIGSPGGTRAAKESLTITLEQVGETKETAYNLVLSGDALNTTETETLTVSIKDSKNTAESESEVTPGNITGGQLTIPVTINGTDQATVKITGLKAGSCSVNAGGNYYADTGSSIIGTASYTSIYQTDGANTEGTAYGTAILTNNPSEATVTIGGAEGAAVDHTIKIQNMYTRATVTLKSGGKALSVSNGTFELYAGDVKLTAPAISVAGQTATVTGLPIMKGSTPVSYGWKLASPPAGYTDPLRGNKQTFTFNASIHSIAIDSTIDTPPTRVQVRAIDDTNHCTIPNGKVTMQVKEQGAGAAIWTGTNGGILEAKLSVGKTYTVTQTASYKGHALTKASYNITVENTGNLQGTVGTNYAAINKPTKVTLGAKTSASGAYLPGAKLEIRQNGKTIKTITTTSSAITLTGELDPGEYTVVSVGMPKGHYAFEPPKLNFKVNADPVDLVLAGYVPVKLSVSRKAYDDRITDANGKDLRYMLEGAKLQIRDENGKVVDEWTTTKEPHLSVGKLDVGKHYTLVEVYTPEGYEPGDEGTISTVLGEKVGTSTSLVVSILSSGGPNDIGRITPSVTMQTGRARGRIRVVMRAAYRGTPIKLNRTFYCALFTDAGRTQMYRPAGVKALTMSANMVYAIAEFENLPSGTYYIGETDSSGRLLGSGEANFDISYVNGKIELGAGKAGIGEITNDFQASPGGDYTHVTAQELEQSYISEYADFGGSPEAAALMAMGETNTQPVKTGDTTQIIPYIATVLIALLVLVIMLVYRRKRK